jgi:hypothetical protein
MQNPMQNRTRPLLLQLEHYFRRYKLKTESPSRTLAIAQHFNSVASILIMY